MIFLFFIIAMIYASAGFGGGSMYLAVLNSVFPSSGVGNKVHGLLCNTGVTLQGSWQWGRAYGKALQQGWPILLCAAISCSFTAYYFRNEGIVQWAMSIALIVAGILLILQDRIESLQFKFHQSVLLSISTLVGALAGMTGKGKPVCVLLHTEMGNGVDFMMHTHAWHGKAPSNEQLENALNQNPATLGDY